MSCSKMLNLKQFSKTRYMYYVQNTKSDSRNDHGTDTENMSEPKTQ